MSQNRLGDISDAPWRRRLSAWLERLPPKQSPPLTAEEIDILLPLAIDDALNDTDVIERYPGLIQAMANDERIAERFLSALEFLEENNPVEDIPPAPALDMAAIRRAHTPAQLSIDAQRRWTLRWREVREALAELIYPPERLAPALRGRGNVPPPPLLQKTETVEGTEIDVALLVEQSPVESDRASVTLIASAEPPLADRALHAAVRWGPYEAGGWFDSLGQLGLPPLTLSSVVDQEQRLVRSDLEVTLSLNDRA